MWGKYPPSKYKTYKFFRNGKTLGQYRGVFFGGKKPFIEFSEKIDVKYGDEIVFPETNFRYFVVNVKTSDASLGLTVNRQFEVYFVDEYHFEKSTFQTVYNINTANNSIIGSQTNAVITVNPLDNLLSEIEKCAASDKPLLYELYEVLKEISNNTKPIKRNTLQKFKDLFVTYSPIALAAGQILLSILS